MAGDHLFDRREHNVSVNGKDRIYYDDVTYVIDEGTVKAVIPRVRSGNVIRDTVCNSFYVVFRERSADHVAGCISLLDGVYQPWTTEEADCFYRNMDAYLSAFTLSGTYEDTDPLRERASKEGVALRKDGGNFLNCTVCNNGSDPWCYGAQLPHVELWYKGVWIELVCPFADNLMTAVVEPGQSRTFDVPEETIMQYPALMDGIYRLVVYGENGDFAVSDTFVVGE